MGPRLPHHRLLRQLNALKMARQRQANVRPLASSSHGPPDPPQLAFKTPSSVLTAIPDNPLHPIPPNAATALAGLLDRLKYLDETTLRARFETHCTMKEGTEGDGSGGGGGGGSGGRGYEARAFLDARGAQEWLVREGSSCSREEAQAMVAALAASAADGAPVHDADAAAAAPKTRVSFPELKRAVDAAALPVDARATPIFATLTLAFASQGLQFPVLPQLARLFELSAADLGLITSSSALGRLLWNVPASLLADRVGRRPLLVAGPAISAVGMAGLACSSGFAHLALSNACIGVGMATATAGAGLYLSDISTPRNRAQTNAPILQSALMGFAIGPAVGGVLAGALGLHLPFLACSAGLLASSAAAFTLLPETLHDATARRRAQQQAQRQDRQQSGSSSSSSSSSSGGGSVSGGEAAAPLLGASSASSSAAAPAASSSGAEEGDAGGGGGGGGLHVVLDLLRRPALQGLFPVVFVNGFAQGAYPVTLVLFGMEHFGMSSAAVGAMLTVNVLTMFGVSRPATVLSDAVASRKAIMVPALAATALLTGLQPLASDPLEFAALVVLSSVGQAVSLPSIAPVLMDATTEAERAKALAMRQTAQDVGTLLGAAAVGVVATQLGIPAAITAVAGLQGAAAFLFAIKVPGVPPPQGISNEQIK